MLKTIHQTMAFPVTPDKLYEMYMNQKLHAAITGQPVTISRTAGTRFRAFGGMILGKTLHVVPKRLIIQSGAARNGSPRTLTRS